MTRPLRFLVSILVLKVFSSCTCTRQDSQPKANVTTLNIFIWGEYTSPRVFKSFQDATGINVVETNYASNEEMLAKLQAGASGYDLAVPSDYMVTAMTKLSLLAEIDHSKITNFNEIDPRLLGREYDRENKYSVPYSWSASGIAFNTSKVTGPVTTYKDLLSRSDLSGHFSLLDDMREAIGAALRIHGHSINTKSRQDLDEARQTLLAAKPRLKEFNSTPSASLLQGDLFAAQMYSNEALRAQLKNPAITFALPTDGYTLSIDNFVILKSSTKKDAAHALINFLISAAANEMFAEDLVAPPVNQKAREKLPQALRNNPILSIPLNVGANTEMQSDLGEFTAEYDRVWTEIKAGS